MIEFTAWGVLVKIWPGEVLGIVMIAASVYLFWKAQRDPKNPIDFATMLVWPGTKHTSLAFVGAFIGILASTWIVVDLELRKMLTWEIFGGYMAVLIGGKGMTEWVNAWRSKGSPPPAQGAQYVASAGTVVQAAAPTTATPDPVIPPPITGPATQAAAAIVAAVKPQKRKKGKR